MGNDERRDEPTDMTADNIAPDDLPTRDPANTEIPADGAEKEEHA